MNIEQSVKRMTDEQLKVLSNAVVAEISRRSVVNRKKIKNELYIGAYVKVNHPRLDGIKCEVTDIRRTKGSIICDMGSFNVPLSLLSVYTD